MSPATLRTRHRPRVCVVIVNWRRANDTIRCLESLMRSEDVAFQAVVCDNGSDDASLDDIEAWAAGRTASEAPARDDALAPLYWPPRAKPLSLSRVEQPAAEAGRAGDEPSQIVLVRVARNLGFAGGCNVGMRYALATGVFDFVWLLNNDTVVPPHALSALVRRMEAVPDAGLCGSRVMFYDEPHRVQCLGGARYGSWLSVTRRIGEGRVDLEDVAPAAVEEAMDCVYGASILARVEYLRDVGLMEESYFMYFEELDWALRRTSRWRLAFADGSVVYHREGASSGSHFDARRRSAFADVCVMRSRLRLTRRFFPYALPLVYAASAAIVVKRAVQGDLRRAALLSRTLLGRSTSTDVVPPPPRRASPPARSAPG